MSRKTGNKLTDQTKPHHTTLNETKRNHTKPGQAHQRTRVENSPSGEERLGILSVMAQTARNHKNNQTKTSGKVCCVFFLVFYASKSESSHGCGSPVMRYSKAPDATHGFHVQSYKRRQSQTKTTTTVKKPCCGCPQTAAFFHIAEDVELYVARAITQMPRRCNTRQLNRTATFICIFIKKNAPFSLFFRL